MNEIKVGRELDIFIAEKVMGFECYASQQSWMQSGMPHIQFWSENVKYPAYWYDEHQQALNVPYYSTNITDAWQMVEKLVEEKLVYIDVSISNFSYKAMISAPDGNYEAEAETAPLAICLSALKAVGIGVVIA